MSALVRMYVSAMTVALWMHVLFVPPPPPYWLTFVGFVLGGAAVTGLLAAIVDYARQR